MSPVCSHGYAAWKVADPSKLGDWTTYNADKANQMLDAAGYKKGADGIRTTARRQEDELHAA